MIKRNAAKVWFSLNCHLIHLRTHTKLNFVSISVPGSFYEHKFSIERNVGRLNILIPFKNALSRELWLFYGVYGYFETFP